MSTEVLRRAAVQMRAFAEPAIGDPPTGESWYRKEEIGDVLAGGAIATEAQAAMDAPFIAAWHPAVALAVADWLDRTAETHEELEPLGLNQPVSPWALSVARAYLGSDA